MGHGISSWFMIYCTVGTILNYSTGDGYNASRVGMVTRKKCNDFFLLTPPTHLLVNINMATVTEGVGFRQDLPS